MIIKKTRKNATALVEGDIIKIAGVKYKVKTAEPTHGYCMDVVLYPIVRQKTPINDMTHLFIPVYLPMDIYKK